MAFNALINSIAPNPTPSDWVRPSDWPVITDTPNEVQFLVCDLNEKIFSLVATFTRTSGNIYIDWGDGVVDTISTTTPVTTNHTYSTGGTPCSRGYNTWKVRVYGDPTCVITNAKFTTTSTLGGSMYYQVGVLEAYFGDNTCNQSTFYPGYFQSNANSSLSPRSPVFQYLEYVKFPQSVAWDGTRFTNLFANCVNLYKVILPSSASSAPNFSGIFSGCINLLDVSLTIASVTNCSNAFLGCTNLRAVALPTSLNECTNISNMFQNCKSLKNITLPSMNKVTSMAQVFDGCNSLQWAKFTSLPAPTVANTAVSATQLFNNCTSLQNIYLPNTCSSNATYDLSSMAFGCSNLKTIILPLNMNASTLSGSFQNCTSLTRVVFQSAMPNLTSMSNLFNGCILLNSFTLPSSVGASITLQTAFSNCSSLQNITIPSSYNITNLNGTFFSCTNLLTITLPNNAQNSCTTMLSMAFACVKLQSIVMPTSLNSVNTLAGSFLNCESLQSVTFPSTMNAVTTMSNTFQNCYEMSSVTLPTSMSACTIFSGTFQNCYNIQSITLPATTGAVTTFASTFLTCNRLSSITFPTTSLTAVSTINEMLRNTSNLTTINNLNNLGATSATPLVDGRLAGTSVSGMFSHLITSLSFRCPFSNFAFSGWNAGNNKLNSLRLLNTGAGQYTGGSPHVQISYNDLSAAALNQVFTDLPTLSGKTINITGCTGAAGCTRSIATAKGWTVTG
jgi:hypothetical protein